MQKRYFLIVCTASLKITSAALVWAENMGAARELAFRCGLPQAPALRILAYRVKGKNLSHGVAHFSIGNPPDLAGAADYFGAVIMRRAK